MKRIKNNWEARLRYAGNGLGLGGYLVLVHLDPCMGSWIKIVASLMVAPSYYKMKIWDALFMIGLFLAIDITGILWA